MARRPYSLSSYQRARKLLLASQPRCAYCPRRATSADHQPPLIKHFHREGSGCCVLVPSCARCGGLQGASLAKCRRPGPPPVDADPEGFDVDHKVWDVDWLDALREIPEDGWWPRLMTVPHHRAVGSLGAEFASWCRREMDVRLHWWQRLVATRLLEHDRAGLLVWVVMFLSVARQSGKSTLVSLLCDWRSEQAERFGEDQFVMHTADTLAHAFEVQQRAHRRAEGRGFTVRLAAGQQQIVKPEGMWVVRAQKAVMGSAVSLAVADEAHAIKLRTITENLMPTLVERAQSQLVLISTAHSNCTELMPVFRADCLAELGEPERMLLLEWSAFPGALLDDRVAARQSSPHWSKRREADVGAAARQALSLPPGHEVRVGFGCQWHNQWPRSGARGPGVPLVDGDVWARCEGALDVDLPGWVAMEANTDGAGAGVAMAVGDDEGRFEIDGVVVDDWSQAWVWVRKFLDARPGSRLLLGRYLETSVPRDLARHQRVGGAETRAGFAILRALLDEGRVVHDGTVMLDEQVAAARVMAAEAGLRLVSSARCDLLKAAARALWAAQQPPPMPRID